MSEKFLTVNDVAKELGICQKTAYTLLRTGKIKARKRNGNYGTKGMGDEWIITRTALNDYIKTYLLPTKE